MMIVDKNFFSHARMIANSPALPSTFIHFISSMRVDISQAVYCLIVGMRVGESLRLVYISCALQETKRHLIACMSSLQLSPND